VYGVQIDGIGLMNSYISGIPSNIVGVGAPHSAELNSYSNEHSKAGKDVTEYLTHTVTSLENTTVAQSTEHHDGILPNGTSSLEIAHADWLLFQQLGGKIIRQTPANKEYMTIAIFHSKGPYHVTIGLGPQHIQSATADDGTTPSAGQGLSIELKMYSDAQTNGEQPPGKTNFTSITTKVIDGGYGYEVGDIITYHISDFKCKGTDIVVPINDATHATTAIKFVVQHAEAGDVVEPKHTAVVKHSRIEEDETHTGHESSGWKVGDQFYILTAEQEKLFHTPAKRIQLAKRLRLGAEHSMNAVGQVTQIIGVEHTRQVEVGGVAWYAPPLQTAGAVVDWTLLDPGTLNYNDEKLNNKTHSIAGIEYNAAEAENEDIDTVCHEWNLENYYTTAEYNDMNTKRLAMLWENQPGFACVYKDSNDHYDFEGEDYYNLSTEANPAGATYHLYSKNILQQTKYDNGSYAGNNYYHIGDRRADLRVLLTTTQRFTMKSHTGGFVNERPFFTDAKLCSVPWGKTLNVKIVDMSHGHRANVYADSVNHFHTLKECNEEGDTQVITSVKKPITVELKVLLIDPEDQNSNY